MGRPLVMLGLLVGGMEAVHLSTSRLWWDGVRGGIPLLVLDGVAGALVAAGVLLAGLRLAETDLRPGRALDLWAAALAVLGALGAATTLWFGFAPVTRTLERPPFTGPQRCGSALVPADYGCAPLATVGRAVLAGVVTVVLCGLVVVRSCRRGQGPRLVVPGPKLGATAGLAALLVAVAVAPKSYAEPPSDLRVDPARFARRSLDLSAAWRLDQVASRTRLAIVAMVVGMFLLGSAALADRLQARRLPAVAIVATALSAAAAGVATGALWLAVIQDYFKGP